MIVHVVLLNSFLHYFWFCFICVFVLFSTITDSERLLLLNKKYGSLIEQQKRADEEIDEEVVITIGPKSSYFFLRLVGKCFLCEVLFILFIQYVVYGHCD